MDTICSWCDFFTIGPPVSLVCPLRYCFSLCLGKPGFPKAGIQSDSWKILATFPIQSQAGFPSICIKQELYTFLHISVLKIGIFWSPFGLMSKGKRSSGLKNYTPRQVILLVVSILLGTTIMTLQHWWSKPIKLQIPWHSVDGQSKSKKICPGRNFWLSSHFIERIVCFLLKIAWLITRKIGRQGS